MHKNNINNDSEINNESSMELWAVVMANAGVHHSNFKRMTHTEANKELVDSALTNCILIKKNVEPDMAKQLITKYLLQTELFLNTCETQLKNDPKNKLLNIIFDYLIEQNYLAKVSAKSSLRAQAYYEIKTRKKIISCISTKNCDELIAFIKSKENEDKTYPDCFKKLVSSVKYKNLTAMDLAISHRSAVLLTTLLACDFFKNAEVNYVDEIIKNIIYNNYDTQNIEIISILLHAEKLIDINTLCRIAEFSICQVKNSSPNDSEERKNFYNAILNNIIAIPDKDVHINRLVMCIYLIRNDMEGFIQFAEKFLLLYGIDFLKRTINLPIINNNSMIEYAVLKNNKAMLKQLLAYHPLGGIKNPRYSILLNILHEIATHQDCINRAEKLAMAEIIIETAYSSKDNSVLAILPALTDKIISYCLNHVSENDDLYFSEILSIIFNNNPDLISKIMAPALYWFKNSNDDESKLYYCESLFAAAAVKEDKTLYNLLLGFIPVEEHELIANHQYHKPADSRIIRVCLDSLDEIPFSLEKNTIYVILYPDKNDFSLKIRFQFVNLLKQPTTEFEFSVSSALQKPLGNFFASSPRQEFETRFHRIMMDLHIQNPGALAQLVEHHYYTSMTVKDCFPSMNKEDNTAREYFAQLKLMRNEAKKQVAEFKTLRKQATEFNRALTREERDALLTIATKASASHLNNLSFATWLKTEAPVNKNFVVTNLRYDLNNILDSLLILIAQITKLSCINNVTSIHCILEPLKEIISSFSSDVDISMIIGDPKKIKLVSDGLDNLISPPQKKRGNNPFNFLPAFKNFIDKQRDFTKGMNITLEDDLDQLPSHFISDLDL